jgi:DNA polymerase III alpha subunit
VFSRQFAWASLTSKASSERLHGALRKHVPSRFENTSELAARANPNAGHLNALASANALESLSGNRRQALWQVVASVPDKGLLRPARVVEELVEMEAPSEAENIVADYRHLGLTLGRHPLALLRQRRCHHGTNAND